MTATAIARTELIQMLRNRSVLVNSLLIPVGASAYFIAQRDTFEELGGLGYIGALLVFTIGAFVLYSTTVTTLAARRQTLFLKRLRSTAASDPAILTGLLLPVSVIALVQVGAILAVFASVAAQPANTVLLVGAIVAGFIMLLALGIATAGITRSPEHAQVTALPISFLTIAAASWIGISGTESFTVLKRALPGGSAAEVVIAAWDGGTPLAEALILFGPTLAWMVAGVVLAAKVFRWEPRA